MKKSLAFFVSFFFFTLVALVLLYFSSFGTILQSVTGFTPTFFLGQSLTKDDSVLYTDFTSTTCFKGKCNMIVYAEQKHIFEDNQWKNVEDAKSLKGSTYNCNVELDGITNAECLDWNYTSVTLKVKTKLKDLPIKIYENKDSVLEKSKNSLKFDSDKEEKVIIIPLIVGEELHLGENSTLVTIRSEVAYDSHVRISPNHNTNYGATASLEFDDGSGYLAMIVFNTVDVPANAVIADAQMYLYFSTSSTSIDKTVYLMNGSCGWLEDEVTWVQCASGQNWSVQGGDYDYTKNWTLTGAGTGWRSFNVTNLVSANTTILKSSNGFLLKGSSTTNQIFRAKEYSGTTSDPYLNITYVSDEEDTTPPTLSVYNTTVDNKTTIALDYNATDAGGISLWWINDTTNFKISQTGLFENNTALSVGIYTVNVSVNDTSNNLASALVTINVTAWVDPCAYTTGNWVITQVCTFNNQPTIQINGNLSIQSGGTLELINTSLNFTSSNQYMIFDNVASGNKLILNGTSRIN